MIKVLVRSTCLIFVRALIKIQEKRQLPHAFIVLKYRPRWEKPKQPYCNYHCLGLPIVWYHSSWYSNEYSVQNWDPTHIDKLKKASPWGACWRFHIAKIKRSRNLYKIHKKISLSIGLQEPMLIKYVCLLSSCLDSSLWWKMFLLLVVYFYMLIDDVVFNCVLCYVVVSLIDACSDR